MRSEIWSLEIRCRMDWTVDPRGNLPVVRQVLGSLRSRGPRGEGQGARPINALDELCRLMKSLVHPKPGAAGSLGAGLIPISSELCYRLGACQIAMCATGMQRCVEAQPGGGTAGRRGRGWTSGGWGGPSMG